MAYQFRFKKFAINDTGCGMPVSTDAVLLGSWVEASAPRTILDIGTGTGVLALMMAQRFSTATITALEIDEGAFGWAQQNAANSPWSSRVKVLWQDARTWQTVQKFELIICNLPYFCSGEPSLDPARAMARHTKELSHRELLQILSDRLCVGGQANLILPILAAQNMILQAKEFDLYCTRAAAVKTTQHKAAKLFLFTLTFSPKPHSVAPLVMTELITLMKEGAKSAQFIALTKDFYLKAP
ncbi:MAG: tRNA1(Val) (adenine(37)-N6)-methyltransferase [Vibrionaceae bacterium]